MIIYSHIITSRLQYVVQFLSQYYLLQVRVTNSAEEFTSYDGITINYSELAHEPAGVCIKPSGLLFSNGIEQLSPDCFRHPAGFTALFASEGDLQFDIFSAVFYLLSRYEEYQPHQQDMYGRYAHQNSIAYKEGFLNVPLVNIWLEYFRMFIEKAAGHTLPCRSFSMSPTYDIDMAWSYSNKGFFRNAGGMVRSLLKGEGKQIKERIKVLTGKSPDPYDAFGWMDDLHSRYDIKAVYFFHAGQKRNRYDKNISTACNSFQELIKQTATKYKVGLHPSWHSGDAEPYLLIEKNVLEGITDFTITASRQHYIRFSMPTTFRRLVAAGIQEDYSMGYPTINGFRASIASPFYWYDLEREEQTGLLLHPFCYMDANSFFELRHTPQEAFQEMLHYYAVVKEVNGTLCTLWHNTFLGTDKLFEGWREVYQTFVEQVAMDNPTTSAQHQPSSQID